MYLVEVIPFVKGLPKDTLTYFSRVSLPVGEVVSVPLRNKQVPALIIAVTDAREQKATLRHSGFLTRPLKNTETTPLLQPSFIHAASEASEFFAAPLPLIFHTFVPSSIIKHLSDLPSLQKEISFSQPHPREVLQQHVIERIGMYKTVFRESLARNESVLLLAPNAIAAEALAANFKKGAAHHVYLLHSNLTPAQQKKQWLSILNSTKPVIAIVTPAFISLPRHDIGLYIIENIGAQQSYQTQTNHMLDARFFVGLLAKVRNARLLAADLVLPLVLAKPTSPDQQEQLEYSLNTFRKTHTQHIIDLSKDIKTAREQKNPYPILAKETQTTLTQALKKRKRFQALFLVARRGVAGQTICMDCGTIMRCRHCHAPMSLHGKSSTRFFLCHRCGASADAKTLCPLCGSWHLKSYGVGVEAVQEALSEIFPTTKQFRIDEDTTKTNRQIMQTLDAFFQTPQAFLVATPKVLSRLTYHPKEIHTTIITSLDALLAAPHFAAEFQTFRQIMLAKEKTSHTFIIQTRTPNHHLIPYLKEGRIAAYLKEELSIRKRLSYPPFATFITITATGSKAAVIKSMQTLLPHIQPYKPRIFQELIPLGKNRFALKALLRLSQWPHPELAALLRHLPPSFHVSIDPADFPS